MTYKGKVDWWIGLSLLAGIGLPVVSVLRMNDKWLLAMPAAFTLFILIALYPQKYETSTEGLIVRAGLTKRVIPWQGNALVSATSDSGSSLALSLDRVLIEHAGGRIRIAPDDQVRFFDDVASHCPQLSRRGMDLVVAFN